VDPVGELPRRLKARVVELRPDDVDSERGGLKGPVDRMLDAAPATA